jgi:hypothetical protein
LGSIEGGDLFTSEETELLIDPEVNDPSVGFRLRILRIRHIVVTGFREL